MPATVYQRLNLLKSEYSRNDLRRIANWINAVWRKNHEEEPPKVEQTENDKVFQVFCYPDDMFDIMDDIIAKYFVNKEKTAVKHNELQEQLKIQKENKPPKSETKGSPKEKGSSRPPAKHGFDKRRTEGQSGTKPHGEWKPREGGFKPKGEWKPGEGGFKPKGEWKPREGGFKPKGEWKPREGGFKPKGEWKPREGDSAPKPHGVWKPSDGEPKARGEWKPRQEGGFKPRGEWKPREGDAHQYNKPKREFDPFSYDYDKKNENTTDDASKPKRKRIGTIVFSADAESANKE